MSCLNGIDKDVRSRKGAGEGEARGEREEGRKLVSATKLKEIFRTKS